MKISKAQLVLVMYDSLQTNGITLDSFCSEYSISIPTFRRYISEIRCYLSNSFSSKEVVFTRSDKTYRIK